VEKKPYLLVVEDDLGLQEQIRWCFDQYDVLTAKNRQEAIAFLRRHEPLVVTLDVGLPPDPDGCSEGLQTLREIISLSPQTKVIMVTGQDNDEIAMQAISSGAYDYYVKPIQPTELSFIVERAFYLANLEQACKQLTQISTQSNLKGIVTANPIMLKVCQMIEKVAPNNIAILLSGESGTGKEVLAKAIHQHSDRKSQPFIAINCAAIPESLLESELFGYEKGAFTGAVKQTLGKIELASGGTLFLDEIGDLPLALQPKLLRFLQEKVIDRLGGRQPIEVDVRIICATHQDLLTAIKTYTFREDLYYRLSEITVKIPPLRERTEDAVLLARVFLTKYAQEFKRPVKRFSEEALQAISQYDWPGNVRELENKIKRAVIMAEGNQIMLEDLELPKVEEQIFALNLKQIRDSAERSAVLKAIHYSHGNLSRASELLGVTRPTLYNLMEKLHIAQNLLLQEV